MITAEIGLFGSCLVVRSDEADALLAALPHAPSWTSGYEWQSEREVWLWLCTVALPTCETVARWCADVNERTAA